MADFSPRLSLVIPAFNESKRLGRTLEILAEFAAGCIGGCEVLVIVETSEDETLDLASRFAKGQANFRIHDNKVHRGKGFAVRTGMLAAHGNLVFYMDADLSVPLEAVDRFAEYFDAHPEVDVLAGNRKHAASRITQPQGGIRRRMGETFNHILRLLALMDLRDTQCGFKAFRRTAAREIFSRQHIDGFAFDVEVLLLAARLGYRVADLPVEWQNSPESHVHIVRDSARMLLDTLRVRRLVARSLREYPP